MSWDETSTVSNARLVPAAVRAQRIDPAMLVDRRLHLVRRGAPSSAKALSTVGSWLRAHEWSDVRQLDAISAAARGSSGPVCD